MVRNRLARSARKRHAHGGGHIGDDGCLSGLAGCQNRLGAADPPDIAGDPVCHDQAVADFDDAIGGFGQFRGVGNDDDGMAVFIHLPQRRHHFLAALAVERAGGLVGEDDLAAIHQRARDRHTLLLTAGQLVGQVIEPGRRAAAKRKSMLARSSRSRAGMPA